MENISTTDSVFDRLVKVLDTNYGYVDEEKAEIVAKRIMRSGLIREEKPHGRWGKNNDCSECGCQPWYERDIHTLNYCPNCGAKMDGDVNGGTDNR